MKPHFMRFALPSAMIVVSANLAAGQSVPVADYHQHIFSPTIAALLAPAGALEPNGPQVAHLGQHNDYDDPPADSAMATWPGPSRSTIHERTYSGSTWRPSWMRVYPRPKRRSW